MRRFTLWGVALVMALGLCSASQPLLAQGITASITGTVEDSAGAALNDATITATNTVQVSSEAPQLQADTTQVSTLIDSKTITGIPLATRNYVELTLLSPGSVTVDNSTLNNGDNVNSGGRPYINGHREQSNNF